MSILSSIDLGTNTCLMLVCEGLPGKTGFRVIEDLATVVRLGQGVDLHRRFQPEAMQRTLSCLKHYSERLRAVGGDPTQTIAVATSGSRDAQNSPEFFETVEKQTGFRFQRISGDEEARYTHLGGLLDGMQPHLTTVIDIGGGSTEFKTSSGGMSVDMGSVRYTERYLKNNPVTDEEFWNCQQAIDSAILHSQLPRWRESLHEDNRLCAVAGTATTLAGWFLELEKFDAEKIDGLVLSRGDIHRQVEELKWRSIQERRSLAGIEEGRADVLLAGALILWRSMELLNFNQVIISTRGLRYGVLQMRRSNSE
ncbi:MAG: Ppx/GppA family phosphatase [Bdellovibrionales bacterium]|nr:Ppx/GppA family phosphatase [Bdellovibrionales bacterium]